jgi:hypothetical protein
MFSSCEIVAKLLLEKAGYVKIQSITGMNPKASFGNFIAARCGVLYPPLRGIVQLTNPVLLRIRYWSFTIIIMFGLEVPQKIK